jgi:hypothetical protein
MRATEREVRAAIMFGMPSMWIMADKDARRGGVFLGFGLVKAI